jgi:predicted transglutaminase-like cysteine proteinase
MQSSWLPFKHSWPSRALLLAEVVIPWGEHHLILIVRLAVRTAAMTSREYHWVRIETPQNPKFRARVRVPASAPRC